jgi:iron complex transport system permease protein
VVALVAPARCSSEARGCRGDVLAVLTGRVKGVDQVVVLSLRLPRILAALLAGGALAVAGAGFQALARNPLAEPSVLGVSSGAAFGVILAQVFGLGGGLVEAVGIAACAFAGALVAGAAVYLIAARGGLPCTPCCWRG